MNRAFRIVVRQAQRQGRCSAALRAAVEEARLGTRSEGPGNTRKGRELRNPGTRSASALEHESIVEEYMGVSNEL